MDDPVGPQLIERELADINPTAGLAEMGNFPLSHVANFGIRLDHDGTVSRFDVTPLDR